MAIIRLRSHPAGQMVAWVSPAFAKRQATRRARTRQKRDILYSLEGACTLPPFLHVWRRHVCEFPRGKGKKAKVADDASSDGLRQAGCRANAQLDAGRAASGTCSQTPSTFSPAMFPTLGLFQKLPCPEKQSCERPNCLFSHSPTVNQVPTVPIPLVAPQPAAAAQVQPTASTSRVPAQTQKQHVVPVKRPISSPLRVAGPSHGTPPREPPSKMQRVGTPQRPAAVPTKAFTPVSRCLPG